MTRREIDLPDIARGARIELLAEAIEAGNKPRALGLWAGMSSEERAELAPMILALMPANGGAAR